MGETHLAISLGITAAKARKSVYFITCHDLITQLNKAFFENKLDSKIKHFYKYDLLIIDEIGYLPIEKQGSNLFFQLIAKRYEKHSTIITTNINFIKWGNVFSDSAIANAILDRLLHHSTVIPIQGTSYRIKDKIQEMKKKIPCAVSQNLHEYFSRKLHFITDFISKYNFKYYKIYLADFRLNPFFTSFS